MKRFLGISFLLLAVMVLAVATCSADIITLTTGRQIEGVIISTEGDFVTVRDSDGIEFRISKDSIASIQLGGVGTAAPTDPIDDDPAPEEVEVAVSRDGIDGDNDTFGTANPLPLNTQGKAELSPRRDRDFFRVVPDSLGVLTFEVEPDSAIAEVGIRIVDGNNSQVHGWTYASRTGQPVSVSLDIGYDRIGLPLVIEVMQRGDNAEYEYLITAKHESVQDPYGLNNRFGLAGPIEFGEAIQAFIFPVGDRDYYWTEVPEAGTVTFDLSTADPTMRLGMRLINRNNSTTHNWVWADDLGEDMSLSIDFSEPTLIYMEVANHGNRRSLIPYTLKTSIRRAPDKYEPNNSLGYAADIELGEEVEAYMFPVRDRDWYRVEVPATGIFSVKIESEDPTMQYGIRLINMDGSQLQSWIYADEPGEAVEVFRSMTPEPIYIEVMQHRDTRGSTIPYTLTTSLEPAVDPHEPNDQFQFATPIQTNQAVRGTIFPRGDRDYYQFSIDQPSLVTIVADSEPPLRLAVRLMDENNRQIQSWVTAPDVGEPVELIREIGDPGKYVMEVQQSGGNAESLEPYTLRVNTSDIPE